MNRLQLVDFKNVKFLGVLCHIYSVWCSGTTDGMQVVQGCWVPRLCPSVQGAGPWHLHSPTIDKEQSGQSWPWCGGKFL